MPIPEIKINVNLAKRLIELCSEQEKIIIQNIEDLEEARDTVEAEKYQLQKLVREADDE